MVARQKEIEISTNRIIIPIAFILCSIIFEVVNFLYIGFVNSAGNRMVFPSYFSRSIILI